MPVPPEVADKGWIWFATRDEGIELHFIPADAPPDTSRRHHFCLQVADMDATRARLEADGAPLIDAGSRIIGRERLFTRDPVWEPGRAGPVHRPEIRSRGPRGVAQPGSAPGWGPGGRRFKSSRPDSRSAWLPRRRRRVRDEPAPGSLPLARFVTR